MAVFLFLPEGISREKNDQSTRCFINRTGFPSESGAAIFLKCFGGFHACPRRFCWQGGIPGSQEHILKKSGESYKDQMGHAEAETPEQFAHEYLHAH